MKRWIHAATDYKGGYAHWERGSYQDELEKFEWYIDNETDDVIGVIEEGDYGYCAYARPDGRKANEEFLGKFDTRRQAENSLVDYYDNGPAFRGNRGDQLEMVLESTDTAPDSDIYVVSLKYEIDDDDICEDTFEVRASSADEAIQSVKDKWNGPIYSLDIIDINPHVSDKDLPYQSHDESATYYRDKQKNRFAAAMENHNQFVADEAYGRR